MCFKRCGFLQADTSSLMPSELSYTGGGGSSAMHSPYPPEGKKEQLKQQKREYKDEKKRIEQELMGALRDPTVVVSADWLKLRGTLRKWTRHYCVLKPGLLMIYKTNKTHKHGQWVGTVLLNTCKLIERPSKKDGFCFKLFHPLDQSIWATRGPMGESHGAVTINLLPTTYLICRAAGDQAGRTWMDGLEISLRCSGLLTQTMHELESAKKQASAHQKDSDSIDGEDGNISEGEAEKHFVEIDELDEHVSENGEASDAGENGDNAQESPWTQSEPEQFGQLGEGAQTEDVGEENKSLVWTLLKQVRPGMDLSKVVLPTFILEPRSFLEKLADYYYHADLLTEAANEEDPLQRMIKVTKFYLSGFYKKPKGLKKPYNPILGETFRCSWHHPDGSTTYYIAEQISHHPPISTIFITNKKAGFNVAGTILAKSKYYGNSLSAMMLGNLRLTLLKRGETYSVSLPYANCKGIMIGTLTMELGGPVTIECDRTAYSTTLDFQLKPFLGGSMNKVKGEIKYGSQTMAEIEGHWDGTMKIQEKGSSKEILWQPTQEIIAKRLPRYEIPYEDLGEWESRKLWNKVSEAIAKEDQYEATNQKTVLEEDQRRRAKSGVPHKTKYFKKNPVKDVYDYIYADYRPWDSHNDVRQIEHDYEIRTISKVRPKNLRIKNNSLSSQDKQKHLSQDGQTEDSSDESIDRSTKRKETKGQLNIDPEVAKQIQENLERMEIAMTRLSAKIEQIGDERFKPSQLLLYVAIFSIMQALLFSMFFR
ncbi:unnamed protein product, partial [Mesorhabditis spiculigera]